MASERNQVWGAATFGVGLAAGGYALHRLFLKFASMTRKPEGILGKALLPTMNYVYAPVADWGMAQLDDVLPYEIMDVGCGGGRNVEELLKKFPDARVVAVDHSLLALEQTRALNEKAIAAGRCVAVQYDVPRLLFSDDRFDLITAFEAIGFWSDLSESFAEIFRVLKPGGVFMIVNLSDGTDQCAKWREKRIAGMRCYQQCQIEDALHHVGFVTVQTSHHFEKTWIALMARKASEPPKEVSATNE